MIPEYQRQELRIEIQMLPQGLLVGSIRLALEESHRDDQREEVVVVLAEEVKKTRFFVVKASAMMDPPRLCENGRVPLTVPRQCGLGAHGLARN